MDTPQSQPLLHAFDSAGTEKAAPPAKAQPVAPIPSHPASQPAAAQQAVTLVGADEAALVHLPAAERELRELLPPTAAHARRAVAAVVRAAAAPRKGR